MKTLIVYELVPSETQFYLTDGDRTELNDCFVNATDEKRFDTKVRQEVSLGKDNEHWAPVSPPFTFSGGKGLRVVHCGFLL